MCKSERLPQMTTATFQSRRFVFYYLCGGDATKCNSPCLIQLLSITCLPKLVCDFECRVLSFQKPWGLILWGFHLFTLSLGPPQCCTIVCLQVAYSKWLRFQRNDCKIGVIFPLTYDADLLCVVLGMLFYVLHQHMRYCSLLNEIQGKCVGFAMGPVWK